MPCHEECVVTIVLVYVTACLAVERCFEGLRT